MANARARQKELLLFPDMAVPKAEHDLFWQRFLRLCTFPCLFLSSLYILNY
jgi:hypothetical protein